MNSSLLPTYKDSHLSGKTLHLVKSGQHFSTWDEYILIKKQHSERINEIFSPDFKRELYKVIKMNLAPLTSLFCLTFFWLPSSLFILTSVSCNLSNGLQTWQCVKKNVWHIRFLFFRNQNMHPQLLPNTSQVIRITCPAVQYIASLPHPQKSQVSCVWIATAWISFMLKHLQL